MRTAAWESEVRVTGALPTFPPTAFSRVFVVGSMIWLGQDERPAQFHIVKLFPSGTLLPCILKEPLAGRKPYELIPLPYEKE